MFDKSNQEFIEGGVEFFATALEKDFKQEVARIRLELAKENLTEDQHLALKEKLAKLTLKYEEQKRNIPYNLF